MSGNRGVVYLGAGKVEVQKIDYPKMQDPRGKKIDHAVILKVVSTNICGSDQHMVRGRTTAQTGLVLGHEITGEVIEKGRDVENLQIGRCKDYTRVAEISGTIDWRSIARAT
jgi:glutathione-independent formaldehyde dehydrogenase